MSGEAQPVEQEARTLGWVPQEEFRGDPAKWADAETFVRRGKEIMPILKKNNEKLTADLQNTRSELDGVKKVLAASQEAIEALKEHQTAATKRAVEESTRELRLQLREARKEGDDNLVEQIEDQLLDIKIAEKAAGKPEEKVTTPAPPAPSAAPVPPELQNWYKQNDWFGVDKRRTAMFYAIAQEERDAGNKKVGVAFFNDVLEKTDGVLSPGSRPASKVEGAGGAPGSGGGGGSNGPTYKDLPTDAKAQCDKDAKKLVGPGRAFKDEAGWRAHFVKHYFTE